jgi:hypothetical protein
MDGRVCFRISDAYLPEPAEVLEALTPETEVVGILVGLSDQGVNQDGFAIVEIYGNHQVIIPVDKLRYVSTGEAES